MDTRRTLSFALVAALLVAASMVSGCASIKKMVTPAAKIVSREATVAAPGADVTGSLADGVPDGVPFWPGATVKDSSASRTSYNATLTTRDSYDDVLAGVATGFKDAGWTVSQDDAGTAGARATMLSVSNDSVEGVVTVADSADETGTVEMGYVLSTTK